jgi:hypothetical protein
LRYDVVQEVAHKTSASNCYLHTDARASRIAKLIEIEIDEEKHIKMT